MASPDPEGMSLLAKVAAALAMVGGPVWGAHKYLEGKLDKKADKETMKEALDKVDAELTLQRGYFKDVFTQMRENEQRAQDRHERLLEKLTK